MHVYPSTFVNESRILKQAGTLLDRGIVDEIVLLGRWAEGLAEEETLRPGLRVVRLKAATPREGGLVGFFRGYLAFQIKAVRRLRTERWDVVSCHSLSVLGVGAYFKVFHQVPVVYEAHELETEVEGARGPKRWVGKAMEYGLIRAADQVVVVSEGIARWYVHRYGLEHVEVVRNVPVAGSEPVKSRILRDAFGIPDEDLLFLYQGVLAPARGTDVLLEVFTGVPRGIHLVLMGFGEMEEEVAVVADAHSNIHLHPAVPPARMSEYTAGADVGITLTRNTCLSHYHSLPNKLFEYLMSGLPQIVSDLPEIARVVRGGDCGWAIEPTVDSLRALMSTLDATDVQAKARNALVERRRWGWQNEEAAVVRTYTRALRRTP